LKEELANHQNPFEDDDQEGEYVLDDDGGNFIYGTSGVMQSEGGENQEYRQDTMEFFDDQNRYYENQSEGEGNRYGQYYRADSPDKE
jgi:hypothetical protein